MAGLLDFLQTDRAPAASGLLSPPGISSSQKAQILFSGLQDAVDASYGRQGNRLATTRAGIDSQLGQDQRRAAFAKIQQAYASGDMNGVRAAVAEALGNGVEIGGINAMAEAGQPKVQNIGGTGYKIDPVTGRTEAVTSPAPEKPMIAGGMISSDNGKTWAAIPGYADQQRVLAGARRAPKAASPSTSTKPSVTGIRPPWQTFGGL